MRCLNEKLSIYHQSITSYYFYEEENTIVKEIKERIYNLFALGCISVVIKRLFEINIYK